MNYAQIIKEKLHTRDLLAAHGIAVGRGGMVCCPIHGEKTPSLKVYDDPLRGWYCFGCHQGGDVIDMARALWGVGFKDAMKQLNDDFALGLPIGKDRGADVALQKEVDLMRARRADQARREVDAERTYWQAHDAWLRNERIILDRAPKTPGEDESDEFVAALMRRAELAGVMECAKDKWMEVRRDRYGAHTVG